jgi:hypothetical protein
LTYILILSPPTKQDNIRTRDSKTYINEYGWSRDFHSRHFGSGEDVVLEKPVKIRNFKSLINELEALLKRVGFGCTLEFI